MNLRRSLVRAALLSLGLAGLSQVASAYYHWTFFAQRSGPFQEARLRFDLNALQDATVSFFIAQQGPAKLVDGDNFPALVSQIRRAGETWNVASSALKVKFGGFQEKPFADVLAEQVTPGIDVVFSDELPPGVLALAEPMTYTDLSYLGTPASPGFAPILRSRLQLASDLSVRAQASYSDIFFLTIVHEFGHTLGLQHSMTASTMSTFITRGTTKAAPLASDDIAGISVLYPTTQFTKATGSIAGHVNVVRTPANLASVVALSSDGTAIGAMTLPDGSFKIDGLPPGEYLVYAHPLPPAQPDEAEPAGIVPPRDLAHAPFPASVEFQTRFYPAVKDWHEATRIQVQAGKTVGGVDFSLPAAAGNRVYNLRMFAYLGANRNIPVHAPPLPAAFNDWMAFSGSGIMLPGTTTMSPGLQVSAISEAAVLNSASLRNFPGSSDFLLIAGSAGAVNRSTPVAVSVVTDDNLYVLPNAFRVTPSKHPLVTSVAGARDGEGQWLATITGENLTDGTRILFDGADALSVKAHEDGTLSVVAPPGANGQQSVVEALGPDGQTSWQLQGAAPPLLYAYEAPAAPAVSLTPDYVLAGTSAMLQVDGAFTNFLAGKTAIGFGGSDISVRQVWVLSPTRMLVNVSVHPKAKLGNVPVTVITGVQLAALGAQLQVRPPAAAQPSLLLPIVNEATSLAGAPVGATIAMRASGVPADVRNWVAVIGGSRTVITRAADGRLLAQIPPAVQAGPAVVQLIPASGVTPPPVLFQIDNAPPRIVEVASGQQASLAASQVRPGEQVVLTVANLEDGFTPTRDQVEVRVGGVLQAVQTLEPGGAPGTWRIGFTLAADTPVGNTQPVTITIGTRMSAAALLAVLGPA